jgi:hypothetical protein
MQRQKTTAATSLRQFLLCTKAREKKGEILKTREKEREKRSSSSTTTTTRTTHKFRAANLLTKISFHHYASREGEWRRCRVILISESHHHKV